MMTKRLEQLVSCELLCIKMLINPKSDVRLQFNFVKWYCFLYVL